MPGNRTFRRFDDRDFQKRLLGALEKPHQGRLVTIVNSALFLWLMSALLITVGGALFTARRDCVRDANTKIEQYYRTAELLDEGTDYIFLQIIEAQSIAEAKSKFDEAVTRSFSEQQTIFGLKVSLERLARLISYESVPIGSLKELLSQPPAANDTGQFAKFFSLTKYIFPSGLNDGDLPQLKSYAASLIDASLRGYKANATLFLAPNCSPYSIIRVFFSQDEQKTISASYIPHSYNTFHPGRD